MANDFRFLKDNDLLTQIKGAVEKERKSTTQVLHLLREVEFRKLYLEKGFDSLFSFSIGYLQYSEASAHRRISAMRTLKELPQVEKKILSGELNLSHLSQVQVFFRNEAKNHKALKKEEKLVVLKELEGKSSRESEKLLLARRPEFFAHDKRREVTESKTEIKVTVDEALVQKLDRLKKLLSHKNPQMSDGELLKEMAEICLQKLDPLKKEVKTPAPGEKNHDKYKPTSNLSTPSRYIPASIKQIIWQRDQGKCQYQDKQSGRFCHSQHKLQIDHKIPWSLGGETEIENLRLLCAAHNQYRAQQAFTLS